MNKQLIIGISGRIGSGKNTVGDFIKKIDSSFEEKSFAYKLKSIVALLAGCDFNLTLTQEGKNTYIPAFNRTIGQMLQEIGTNALRDHFDKNVWINSLLADLKEGRNYIITDVRFKNEAEELKKIGAVLIRVNRTNNVIAENSNRNLLHSSEIDLDDYQGFDYIIENNSTLDHLEDVVNTIVSVLKMDNVAEKI